ncbi:MFS transporter [Ferviditalea candida]|uniref:MFS transporter n=1 Tax=Ferviditalea candida TaxID=3108399 RepID=A0ABU5ZCV4_9BACL|nr:MFS transporter [Paenibacillaceae bacterium T2]
MKTAIWLYLFTFVAIFDLHAQYPILTPFALSLGAAPSFIGLIMGAYSLTHIPGNLLAGYGIDRYGSRIFISASLLGAGALLLYQSQITDPYQLLAVRSISGFALAFLSPASLSLLAKIAKDKLQQGKFMAGNGLVHTFASVASPAAGAYLVAKVGFTTAFTVLGWGLIMSGLFAFIWIRDARRPVELSMPPVQFAGSSTSRSGLNMRNQPSFPWQIFFIPLALSFSQGILYFELPLMEASRQSVISSGILFSMVSFGSLLTLSMFFLNRLSSFVRTAAGSLAMAITFFGMAVDWPLPFSLSLFMLGMTMGLIFPALSTLLANLTDSSRYGRVFAYLSITYSIGAFFGPIFAGQMRDHASISPYYIAFLALMAALAVVPAGRIPKILTSRTG